MRAERSGSNKSNKDDNKKEKQQILKDIDKAQTKKRPARGNRS